jgi:DMSO/TMAO reductase YedYZ molybdopterin-dependent catalytic subunit
MGGVVDPFSPFKSRPPVDGDYVREELALAYRNSALPLEALAYDLTPVGLHYTLSHFDIPRIDAAKFRLAVGGNVVRPLTLGLEEIRALPARTQRVTLECAGNGRGFMRPRSASMPWLYEGVGTAEWTGTPLSNVLALAGVAPAAVEVAFLGADRGYDRGVEHDFGRSLRLEAAMTDDVLLAWAMNGAPLAPQHGYPLRLIVPGWFGMASVKWLTRIDVLGHPFNGQQQVVGYHYRQHNDDPGVPVTFQKVKSLMVPPGIPIGTRGSGWSSRGW